MREYLLGTLEAEKRSALEERILCDPQVYEELLLIEDDLIDQYVAGGLSKAEQRQFETHLLNTAERQKNLRFGQLLKARLNSDPTYANKTAPAKSLPFYLAPFRKVPALAIAGALLVCLAIVLFSWLMAQQSAEGLVRQNASGLLVVTLSPGSTKTSGTTQLLTLPRGVDVKLELELTDRSFHNYRAQLFRDSEALDTSDALKMEAKGDHHIVPVTIAGGLLTPGEYQVRLIGVLDSGKDQLIDHYPFRVISH